MDCQGNAGSAALPACNSISAEVLHRNDRLLREGYACGSATGLCGESELRECADADGERAAGGASQPATAGSEGVSSSGLIDRQIWKCCHPVHGILGHSSAQSAAAGIV